MNFWEFLTIFALGCLTVKAIEYICYTIMAAKLMKMDKTIDEFVKKAEKKTKKATKEKKGEE